MQLTQYAIVMGDGPRMPDTWPTPPALVAAELPSGCRNKPSSIRSFPVHARTSSELASLCLHRQQLSHLGSACTVIISHRIQPTYEIWNFSLDQEYGGGIRNKTDNEDEPDACGPAGFQDVLNFAQSCALSCVPPACLCTGMPGRVHMCAWLQRQ